MRKIYPVLLCVLVIWSCDHGIDPQDWVEPGFGGKINFIGAWPPLDSLQDLRLVVYKKYPPPNFFEFVKFSDKLSFNVDSYQYKLLIPPGTYEYIAIAQQYGPNIFLHWRAVGFFSAQSDKKLPGSINVQENTFLNNVDITVDFDHLPVQPFLEFKADRIHQNEIINKNSEIFNPIISKIKS